jgi:hypothetical protein
MNRLQIFVDSVEVDYTDSLERPISLSRNSTESQDLTKRAGDITYRFELPLTPRNRKVFGPVDDLATVLKFKRFSPFAVDILANGFSVMRNGQLIVEEVDSANNVVVVRAVASNINWSAFLSQLRLRDLRFEGLQLSNYSTIQDWNNTYDPTNPDRRTVVFPLVFYAPVFVPNKWSPANNQHIYNRTIYPDGTVTLPPGREIGGLTQYVIRQESNCHLTYLNFLPAVSVAETMRAVFARIGYQLVGEWLDDPEVRKLFILYTGDGPPVLNWHQLGYVRWVQKSVAPLPDLGSSYFVSGVGINVLLNSLPPRFFLFRSFRGNDTTSGFQTIIRDTDIGNATTGNNTAYHYICRYTGTYRVRFVLQNYTVDIPANPTTLDSAVYLMAVLRNSDGTYSPPVFVAPNPAGFVFDPGVVLLRHLLNPAAVTNGSLNVELSFEATEGQLISFGFGYVTEFQVTPFVVDSILIDYSFPNAFEIVVHPLVPFPPPPPPVGANGLPVFTPPPPPVLGDTLLRPQNLLPDINAAEFIKDMVTAFHLYIDVNTETKIAYISPWADFFDTAVLNAVDITSLIKKDTIITRPNKIARSYLFSWPQDGDAVMTRYPANAFGVLLNLPLAGTEPEQRVEVKNFAATANGSVVVARDANNDFLAPNFVPEAYLEVPVLCEPDALSQPQNTFANLSSNYRWKPRIVKIVERATLPTGTYLNVRTWDVADPNPENRDKFIQETEYLRVEFQDLRPDPGTSKIWSLSFGGDSGLFKRVYENWYNNVTDGHTVEVDAYVTPSVYSKLGIRSLVRIEGSIYRIVSIQGYFPGANSTVKLILERKI